MWTGEREKSGEAVTLWKLIRRDVDRGEREEW